MTPREAKRVQKEVHDLDMSTDFSNKRKEGCLTTSSASA